MNREEGRGLRKTFQRQTILEQLRRMKTHPKAEDLYRMVRKRIPTLSLGTVYRNLNLLREQGLILELALGRDASHWDGDPHPHPHFVCRGCNRVVDLALPRGAELVQGVEEETGFEVSTYQLEFYGLCQKCLGKQKEV
ncbi:MAG: transcriptional repressor [Chloroflexi bacterium]|nr:transcriptional repressor [Chloroflexota bacterium]